MVKSMKGKLDVGEPRQWYGPLLYRPENVAEIFTLPAHHQDLFDRALIAQATVEDVGDDRCHHSAYASRTFRVVR